MRDPGRFEELMRRVGRAHFRQRVYIQLHHASSAFSRQGLTRFHVANASWLDTILYCLLKLTFTYGLGHRNYQQIRVRRNTIRLRDLPSAFGGFTIMQMSDLHLDLDTALTGRIIDCIKPLTYDLCVMTGDFRNLTTGDFMPVVEELARLVPHIQSPIYAVLGNHDFIEQVIPFEDLGVRVLLNETVPLERNGARVYLSGVDDHHLYLTDNIERAMDGIPEASVSILLCHTPEIYPKAVACGYDLLLCGHTHGGQVCLPGGIPILTESTSPRWMASGPWSYGPMQGYTSPGTGSQGVPVRFFCPPEITLHVLEPAEEEP